MIFSIFLEKWFDFVLLFAIFFPGNVKMTGNLMAESFDGGKFSFLEF